MIGRIKIAFLALVVGIVAVGVVQVRPAAALGNNCHWKTQSDMSMPLASVVLVSYLIRGRAHL